jgi:hypothetical protein
MVAFNEGKTEPNPHGGNLTKFYVDFIGADETEVPDVYWRRKEGNAPEIQKPVFGTISQGNYGPMFKLEQKDGFKQQQTQGAAGTQAVSDVNWDERQRRIERQHSQEMALRLITATGDASDIDLSDANLARTYLNEVVRKLTDWFAKDLEAR